MNIKKYQIFVQKLVLQSILVVLKINKKKKFVKYVEKFEQAGYGEGDAGVTIAYFRQ